MKKSNPYIVFLILGLLFGITAVIFGTTKEMRVTPNSVVSYYYVSHADAAIHACGLIVAACFVTAGFIYVKTGNKSYLFTYYQPFLRLVLGFASMLIATGSSFACSTIGVGWDWVSLRFSQS